MTASPEARELALRLVSLIEDMAVDEWTRRIKFALDAARTNGIEAAARWHDDYAEQLADSDEPGDMEFALNHRNYASLIRSIKQEKPHA